MSRLRSKTHMCCVERAAAIVSSFTIAASLFATHRVTLLAILKNPSVERKAINSASFRTRS
jgi:hypothetical protein